jgi:hypothetical protein
MLAHWTVFVLYVRMIFSLNFVSALRQFLQIIVNIVVGIVPFSLILAMFTFLTALNGYLVPNPKEGTYLAELQETFLGIYLGDVRLHGLPGRAGGPAQGIIVISRQIFLSLFLLNGILVGIVSNIYGEGEAKARLINIQSMVAFISEAELFYVRAERLLALLRIHNRPRFLHAFITT